MSQADHTCCGVVEGVRSRRSGRKPQPWIVRKFAVGFTVLIVGYSSYVYAGRFCRDMIVRSGSALGNRATGVAFLVVFSLLLLMTSWCYLVVASTSPGNARQVGTSETSHISPLIPAPVLGRQYTQTTTRPGYDHIDRSSTLNSTDVRGFSYELTSPTPNTFHPPTHEPAGNQPLGSRTVTSATASSVGKPEQNARAQPSARGLTEARAATEFGASESPHIPDATTHANPYQSGPSPPPPMFSRRPTTTPVLLPEYRYCSRCKIVKPSRAHHCRACGTCILKYDHHCPWIGQCVGAFNQKYFVNFLQWAMVSWFWTFATLLGLNVRPHSTSQLDPQQIVVIGLSGLFGLFSALILQWQIHLILLNQTTVESLGFRSMRDREEELMSQMHKWYHFCAKRRTRKQWDSEWGRIGIEGNLWWLGSRRENWVAVMGKNKWWWILPIGRSLDDGMNYPPNPRFDSAGRWKSRKEWPSDLQ